MSIQANKDAKVIRVGNKGTVTTITMKRPDDTIYNLTNTTTVQMEFEMPNGTRLVRTATKVNPPGTDGQIRYVDSDDNNKVFYSTTAKRGTWWARGIATNNDGTIFNGSWESFPVGD